MFDPGQSKTEDKCCWTLLVGALKYNIDMNKTQRTETFDCKAQTQFDLVKADERSIPRIIYQ